MKPYGIDPKDRGCCPGHDKFPKDTYNTRPSKKAKRRSDRIAHKRARARNKQELNKLKDD